MKKLIIVAVASMIACGSGPSAKNVEPAPPPIAWQAFGPAAFEAARRDDKLVMVDVGIEGCTACNYMLKHTYHDANVVRRIEASFVPVAVDADARPDLGERWEAWGWPATIFLSPKGEQLYAIQGSETPDSLAKILDDLVAKKKAGKLVPDASATAPKDNGGRADLAAICADTKRMLDAMTADNGWGSMRIPISPPFEWTMTRAHMRSDAAAEKRAIAFATGLEKLIDPVWSGIYVASDAKFDGPIPEKRTVHQAAALVDFAEALHLTHDARFAKDAASIRKYMEGEMRDADGTFYSTQKDRPPNLPKGTSAEKYWSLDDAGRRALGVPPIDHGVYTDQNGAMIEAYVRFWEASRDASALDVAKEAAEKLLADRQTPDGYMLSTKRASAVSSDERIRAAAFDDRIYLKAQGAFGSALLALYEATGDEKWKSAAERIAKALRSKLEDPRGGFFETTQSESDAFVPRRKPMWDNGVAGRFLLRLASLERDADMRASAEKALAATFDVRALAHEGPWMLGIALVALEDALAGPVEVSIVREKDSAESAALIAAAIDAYEPRKIVHAELPGHYPKPKGAATAYVCTLTSCSSPVTDPKALVETMARAGKLASDPCDGK
jgi:uncharacterized protein YyaL (SSP411 family)